MTGDMRYLGITELCSQLRIAMRDPSLLRRALTHRSQAPQAPLDSYERLEFLGDSVVGAVVCEHLYRACPTCSEGALAKQRSHLVSKPVLAAAARSMGLNRTAHLAPVLSSAGERAEASLLADVFEAVVGAVFLDRGYRTARRVVNEALDLQYQLAQNGHSGHDYKTELQEITQAECRDLPRYEIAPPVGEDHRPTFTATVHVRGVMLGQGSGRSKREAEQAAAREALARWNRALGAHLTTLRVEDQEETAGEQG